MREDRYRTTNEKIEAMERELSKDKKPSVVSTVLNIFLSVVILILLAVLFVVARAKISGHVPTLFSYQIYRVQTSSMEPTFGAGDIILCKQTFAPQDLEEGVVVTYRSNESYVTHRIVEVVNDENGNVYYRTKGDNPTNGVDLLLLSPSNIESVYVIKLPF